MLRASSKGSFMVVEACEYGSLAVAEDELSTFATDVLSSRRLFLL